MKIDLSGKVALVTGGANGLGKVIVRKLAEAGAFVAFTSRNEEALASLSSEIGNNHLAIHADVTQAGDLSRTSEQIGQRFGGVNILINNIGHTLEVTNPYCSKADWARVMDLNFLTHVEVTNTFLPQMKTADWGRIVNVTSIAGLEVSGPGPFNAAKAALTAYTRSIGRLLAIENNNVVMTAVAPGIVVTEGGHWDVILRDNPEHARKYLEQRSALGRFGTVDEVTDIIVFLSSDQASFFHGSIIQVDGGQSRHYMYYSYMD